MFFFKKGLGLYLRKIFGRSTKLLPNYVILRHQFQLPKFVHKRQWSYPNRHTVCQIYESVDQILGLEGFAQLFNFFKSTILVTPSEQIKILSPEITFTWSTSMKSISCPIHRQGMYIMLRHILGRLGSVLSNQFCGKSMGFRWFL